MSSHYALALVRCICNHGLVTHIKYEQFIWNWPRGTAARSQWWSVDIGSGNGLVPSGKKQLPDGNKPLHGHICWPSSMTPNCVSRPQLINSLRQSDANMSPGRRQAIIWINAGIVLTGSLGTNFSEIWIEIYTFSFKKMNLKMPSASCLGLNMLTTRIKWTAGITEISYNRVIIP